MPRTGPRPASLGVVLYFGFLVAQPAAATIFHVEADGSGDYPTIQAAISAAIDGDIVELADGTYTGDGNRDVDFLNRVITVRSRSGDPATCVIDCEGSPAEPHRAFGFVSGEPAGSVLTGLTVRNGWITHPDQGGAIECDNASSPTIESCVFTGNATTVISCETGCSPTIVGCLFEKNQGSDGSAIRSSGASLTISHCDFVENESDRGAAAIFGFNTDAVITHCSFLGNSGGQAGGAVEFTEGCQVTLGDCMFADNSGSWSIVRLFLQCDSTIERCTFTGNTGWAAIYSGKISKLLVENCTFWGNQSGTGTIACGNHTSILRNNLISGDSSGLGVWCPYDLVVLTCCDIHGNVGGDWVGRIADQYGTNGNICEPPLLCDPSSGDFALDQASPCAPLSPPNPECNLIGAWPIGCGATPTVSSTWGAIKVRFRDEP